PTGTRGRRRSRRRVARSARARAAGRGRGVPAARRSGRPRAPGDSMGLDFLRSGVVGSLHAAEPPVQMTEPAVAVSAGTNGGVEVGERLRAIRLLRRLTLRDVAEAAGVSESFVSQLERGRSSASVATLQRLAAAVGIEISDLFAAERQAVPRVLR